MDGALTKKADPRSHEAGRDVLWQYSPLMLYARDVDLENWNRIIQIYQDKSQLLYKSEFREALEAWKKNARKPTGEEAELLFTYQQEKKDEGIATTARKLTVKRSQTLARSLRSPLGDGSRTNLDKTAVDNRSLPYEVFGSVLDELLPLVVMEQNFIVDFFHATTLEQADFSEAVGAVWPKDRRGGDLKRRPQAPPAHGARPGTGATGDAGHGGCLFVSRAGRPEAGGLGALDGSLVSLLPHPIPLSFVNQRGIQPLTIQLDNRQGIGVLAALERKQAEMGQSNQDFLNNILQKLHGN